MKNDILEITDIELLVNTFYGKIQQDDLIGGVFMGVVKDWPVHLEKMVRFWQTILMSEVTYRGQSFEPHQHLPLEKKHFDRWMKLWRETVYEFFEGEKADEAIMRAEKIAEVFLIKIEYLRSQKQ